MTERDPESNQSLWQWLWINIALVVAVATTIVLLTTEVVVAFLLSDSRAESGLSLMIIVTGVALGWLLGMFASPYNKGELSEFRALGATASAFVSGYLLARVDPLVMALLDKGNAAQPLHAFRLLSFVTAVIVSALFTFVCRRYLDEADSDDPTEASAEVPKA